MEKRLTSEEVRHIYRNANGNPISNKTLWVWKTELNMPHRKIGGACYFNEADLEKWEAKFEQSVNINISLTDNRPRSIIRQVKAPPLKLEVV